MGTNYYAIKRKPSLYSGALHIGKSSAGWKFLFQGYQDAEKNISDETLNINSIEDWKKYLDTEELVILDEYDREISYEDFFKLVEEKQSEENEDNFVNCANIGGYRFTFYDFS